MQQIWMTDKDGIIIDEAGEQFIVTVESPSEAMLILGEDAAAKLCAFLNARLALRCRKAREAKEISNVGLELA